MARALLTAFLATISASLCLPLSAQARTPCPGEQVTPTALNSALVSDAIFCLSNQVRANYGLPAFHRDARLDTAARLQSEDMSDGSFFAHTNPEGLTPNDRAVAQGYTLGVGENIAQGYAPASEVVLRWMASPGHCRNMLSGAVDFGVGTAVTTMPYYSQEFGDYYSQWVDEAPADSCPYTLDLDALTIVAPRVRDLLAVVAARRRNRARSASPTSCQAGPSGTCGAGIRDPARAERALALPNALSRREPRHDDLVQAVERGEGDVPRRACAGARRALPHDGGKPRAPRHGGRQQAALRGPARHEGAATRPVSPAGGGEGHGRAGVGGQARRVHRRASVARTALRTTARRTQNSGSARGSLRCWRHRVQSTATSSWRSAAWSR